MYEYSNFVKLCVNTNYVVVMGYIIYKQLYLQLLGTSLLQGEV